MFFWLLPSFIFMHERCQLVIPRVRPTEYIQSGKLAIVDFWRAFQHDGKICPSWWGWGMHAHPLLLYLPSRTKFQSSLISTLYLLCGSALSCYRENFKFTHQKNTFLGSLKTFKLSMVLTAKRATVPFFSSLNPNKPRGICPLRLYSS